MKKTLLAILLISALSLTASAQSPGSKLSEEQKKELKAKMDAYRAQLNLSEEQETKVEAVNAEYIEELSKLKESNASRMKKYKALKQANQTRDRKMKEILTADQYKIFKAQQQEMKEELKARRSSGG
jgi:Spy/CpxP family protein refolding chaperone